MLMQGKPQTLVIGIGNAYRGDDGAGLRVAALLKECADDSFIVLEQSGESAALIDSWQGAGHVFLIDAAQSGALAGTIHRLEASAVELPRHFLNTSTHAFGAAQAIELARALNQLPPRLTVYAIEGDCFDSGAALSIEVAQAASKVALQILAELQGIRQGRRH